MTAADEMFLALLAWGALVIVVVAFLVVEVVERHLDRRRLGRDR